MHKANPLSQRLATIPGIGVIIALTLAIEIDPAAFKSGRHLAAWIGLTPKEHSTAGKQRMGGISRGAPDRGRHHRCGIVPLAASRRRARDCGGRRHRAAPKRLPAVRLQVGAGPGTSADVQVVATASRTLVDVQTWHFDTTGQSRRTTPAPAYRSAKPAGCTYCSARQLPLPQRPSPDRAGSNWPFARIGGRNQNSPVHLQKSAKLACLPIDGSCGGDNGKRLCRACNKKSRAGRSPVTGHNRVREHPVKPARPRSDGGNPSRPTAGKCGPTRCGNTWPSLPSHGENRFHASAIV
jgi:hypothetical protein